MPRNKVSIEERIEAAKRCSEGKISKSEAARRLNVHESTIDEWVLLYNEKGAVGLQSLEHNKAYPEELKEAAVKEYLSGGKSLRRISAKYGLLSSKTLRQWIKVYNSGREFGHKMSGGSRMKQGRETTQEERIIIAKDCLENGSNFGETALKYNVSYQQVYTWVKKYRELGDAGLEDRRGKKTAAQDPRTELEKAQIEIAQLKHKLYMAEMERDLLKKLDELERRDASRK